MWREVAKYTVRQYHILHTQTDYITITKNKRTYSLYMPKKEEEAEEEGYSTQEPARSVVGMHTDHRFLGNGGMNGIVVGV